MVDGEGPQVPEVDGGADRALKEPDDDDDADQAGQVARDGGARDAEHGDRPHAADEDKVPGDVQKVDDDRDEHRLLGEAVRAEEGDEGQVDGLQGHADADDAQVGARLGHQFRRDPHQPVDLRGKKGEGDEDDKRERDVDHERNGVGLGDPLGAARADVLGDQDGRRHADDRKGDEQQIGDDVGVADRCDGGGGGAGHHHLVDVADEHLEDQFDEDRPGKLEEVPARIDILIHKRPLFTS